VWKRFRADKQRNLLRDEVVRMRTRLTGGGGRGWRWALRDVHLEAGPGESVGLIGANGSGKSTFLKILTRVMYPYAGNVSVTGRVGALIEVRAGIHPDLTGRENILLYGSLLGLTRTDVLARFDAMVDFAELHQAIDRQVKHYSSGMTMRLGFAVAAFLEPDVLLVDEVLAVGDSSFQQRCLDRMRTVLSEGTTLVFVSHDLAAVEATCQRGIWLSDGVVRAEGPIRETLGAYRQSIEELAQLTTTQGDGLRLLKAQALRGGEMAKTNEDLDITLVLDSDEPRDTALFLGVSEGPATPIFVLRSDVPLGVGETEVRCAIERLPLPRGRYYLWAGIFEPGINIKNLLPWQPVSSFEVVGPDLDAAPQAVVRLAPVYVKANWDIGGR
jgi:ABC-type polysaccharide/polyol phosphate transport system ATPase subunit